MIAAYCASSNGVSSCGKQCEKVIQFEHGVTADRHGVRVLLEPSGGRGWQGVNVQVKSLSWVSVSSDMFHSSPLKKEGALYAFARRLSVPLMLEMYI